MAIINKINNIYAKVENVMVYLAGTLLIVMMGFNGLEIVFRKLIGTGIQGVFEISTEIMTAVTLLGIAYVQRKKDHIQIDLLNNIFSEKIMKVIETFAYMVVTVILFIFATQGFINFQSALKSGEHTIGILSVPLWPGKLVVSISFYLASFRFLLDSILSINELFTKKQ